MSDRHLRITQVSTADALGGAERVAWNLFDAYRRRGHESRLAVGRKRTDDADVAAIDNRQSTSPWARFWWSIHRRAQPHYGRVPGARTVLRATQRLAEPAGWLDAWRGIEDFHFPGASHLLSLFGREPDVLHCHNLHGKYFDLRALPALSARVPTILTLHDAWLLAGHCAHSFDCERWKTGCGACPDLSIYPATRRDATAFNWQRKRSIYEQCRLYVATPSRWLMERVEQSMLAPSMTEARVIANGVDLGTFRPGDRSSARDMLGIPQDCPVVLFAAAGIRNNIWKDFRTLREAIARLASADTPGRPGSLQFIALGEGGESERVGRAEITFIPPVSDPARVALYYQAADVYVHAARVDTFPNTVIEALACGTPVVATAVGGIPEQVRSLCTSVARGVDARIVGSDQATGILVRAADPEALAYALGDVLVDDRMRSRLGENAAADASRRFDLQRQVNDYLAWYFEIIENRANDSSRVRGNKSRPTSRPRAGQRRREHAVPVH